MVDVGEEERYLRQLALEACKSGDVESLLQTLSISRTVDTKILVDCVETSTQMTGLHFACQSGNLKIAQVLVSHQADVGAIDNFHKLGLHYACERGHLELLPVILQSTLAVERVRSQEAKSAWTLLHTASSAGNLDIVKYLINSYGSDVNGTTATGETAIHLATIQDYDQVVEALINAGGSIHAKVQPFGDTCLHYACKHGAYKTGRLLVKNGANVHESNKTALKQTPLEVARDFNHSALTNELTELARAHREKVGLNLSKEYKAKKKELQSLRLQLEKKKERDEEIRVERAKIALYERRKKLEKALKQEQAEAQEKAKLEGMARMKALLDRTKKK